MKVKENDIQVTLWKIGAVKAANAVEDFVRYGIDLTDEVKYLSDTSQQAYLAVWTLARQDAAYFFPDMEIPIRKMFEKVFDKCFKL